MRPKGRRVRQLTRSLQARPLNELEKAYVKNRLNPKQAPLFFSLAVFEQRHALEVCRTLASGGFGADRDLIQAALLHDTGKRDSKTGRSIPLWAKVVNVVLSTFGGNGLVKRLANSAPNSWGYIFYLQIHHEEQGARLVREAGSSEKTVFLVGNNRNLPPEYELAAKRLAWADDLN